MNLKDLAKKNYGRGLWTVEMLSALVEKGKLSAADLMEITESATQEEGAKG